LAGDAIVLVDDSSSGTIETPMIRRAELSTDPTLPPPLFGSVQVTTEHPDASTEIELFVVDDIGTPLIGPVTSSGTGMDTVNIDLSSLSPAVTEIAVQGTLTPGSTPRLLAIEIVVPEPSARIALVAGAAFLALLCRRNGARPLGL
jgi:hypothetical protein